MGFVSLALLILQLSAHGWPGGQKNSAVEWKRLTDGIEWAECPGDSGGALFVGFAGWSVRQPWVNNWVEELWKARLGEFNVGTLVAVKGPDDVDYASREIDTESLAGFIIAGVIREGGFRRVIVAAHSSGSYVAHALFSQLYGEGGIDRSGITSGTIVYFNLDGDVGSETFGVPITPAIIDRLEKVYAVSVVDTLTGLTSPNAEAMEQLADLHPPKSASLQLNVEGSGCTGVWCLHETVINRVPHNKTTFDLEQDYYCINEYHPVMTAYLDLLDEEWNGR